MLLIAVVLSCAVLPACQPPEPIRIGFVGGTSGRVADLGIAGRDAVVLAVELRNQAGGVAGRKVELLIQDDEPGRRAPIIASEWAATERLIELGGKAVEGVIVAQNFDRDSTAPRYRAFYQAYRDRFHREPGFGGVIAFDAANVVLDALARHQDPRNLKETILALRRFEGVQEPILFDEFGDVKRNLHITAVRDGQLVVIE